MVNEMQNMKDSHEALLDDLLELAWGIIANANGGDWDKATPEWHDAAERWRDRYFAILPTCSSGPCPETPELIND